MVCSAHPTVFVCTDGSKNCFTTLKPVFLARNRYTRPPIGQLPSVGLGQYMAFARMLQVRFANKFDRYEEI